ncbi:MAG: Na+/H+ antiporter subunit E [Paracoccaceae bacterium]
MLRTIITVVVLFCLWLLMSGIYQGFIVMLGFIAAAIAVFVVRRMDDVADTGRLEIRLKILNTIGYFFWLLVEIAKSNLLVTKTILGLNPSIKQHFFKVPCTQETEVGKTTFANSITLTPGTISVEHEGEEIWVHALSYSEEDLDALADMNSRVSNIERAV